MDVNEIKKYAEDYRKFLDSYKMGEPDCLEDLTFIEYINLRRL